MITCQDDDDDIIQEFTKKIILYLYSCLRWCSVLLRYSTNSGGKGLMAEWSLTSLSQSFSLHFARPPIHLRKLYFVFNVK